jgi:cytochrome c oxidase assembly protein subunit 15
MRSGGKGATVNGALSIAAAVFVQAALGIVTLLHQAPVSLSLMHQGMAIIALTLAVLHAERLSWARAA